MSSAGLFRIVAIIGLVSLACSGGRTLMLAKDAGNGSAGGSGAPECLSLPGGTCSSMVNGCAVCPAGSYVHPTQAGCPMGVNWCCTKAAPEANACTGGGGVCVTRGAACPNAWIKTQAACGDGAECCVADADECPEFPQKCVDLGGVCTPNRWSTCPLGMEIRSLGDQGGCEKNWDGWCCVDAPPSSCSDVGPGVCVPGECKGCFFPVSDPEFSLPKPYPTCESGRSCCLDLCD